MKGLLRKTAIISLLLLSASAFAWTIGPMNYQGRLLDNAGVPVTGSYNFKVRIYDALSGGTLKFSEDQNSIAVNDGVYSFLVSTGTNSTGTWDINLWNTASLYLEIEVSGQTLTPRHLLASAPFAFQANLALTTNNALALGGKTAAQYDSTLQAICVSSKGKWLELANAGTGTCLGAGSKFTGTAVSWNTLTADSDFTNLDLTNANINGISFTGADLTGTLFRKTTYRVTGMSGANLSNTVWDGATTLAGAVNSLAANTNLSGATLKNMDLSKWNFSLIVDPNNLTYFSAAYLTACPAAIFGYAYSPWQCRLMKTGGTQYFMVGGLANFSTTSAAATTSYGAIYLDLDSTAFDNVGTDYAKFNGVVLTQNFLNGSFYGASLDYATLRNINFTNTNFNGTWVGTVWENITVGSGISMNSADLSGAKLSNVTFKNDPALPNFTKASLKNVDFIGTGGAGGPNFTDATLENVRISYLRNSSGTAVFDRTRIYGRLHVESINTTDTATMIFKDMEFYGATVTGAFTDINFTGTLSIKYSAFKNLDLCSTVTPAGLDLTTVKVEGPVECPDGFDITAGGTCTGHLTQTALANCTAGVP